MSADIWLVDATGERVTLDTTVDAELRALVPMRAPYEVNPDSVNLTYNLSPMLHAAGMPSWRDLLGMRAKKAGQTWRKVVLELTRDPAKYRALNPENGWGRYEDALLVLSILVANCALHPDAVVDGWL